MKLEAFVVSDLHLGAGAEEPELEDFAQDAELAGFVERIARPGTTLVFNGDFIDFPQIPGYEVAPVDYLLWDEAASLAKLELALKAHPRPFEALATFVQRGGELRIHVGNHDLDLAWPSVQARLRDVVGKDAQFELSHSLYHGVHIEHGHMFTPENAPTDATHFIHSITLPGGEEHAYLERVWGTDFMLQFYNALERENPFADNVKPMLTAAYYGIKNGWVNGRDLVRLLLFLKRAGLPWTGVTSAVLTGGASEVDVPKSIQDEAWQRVIGERMAKDPAFRSELRQAVRGLPAEQQALLADPKKVSLEVAGAEKESHGPTLGLFRDDRQVRAAKDRLKADGVTHVIFGHTHEIVDGDLDGCLYNPGTWLPHMDFNRPDVKAKIKAHGLTLEMLSDASLYDRVRKVAHVVPDPGGRSRVELVLADDVT